MRASRSARLLMPPARAEIASEFRYRNPMIDPNTLYFAVSQSGETADTLGAMGTIMNLPDGTSTTTIESKTNFLGAVPVGTCLVGEATPVHRGKTTMVWQTRISTQGGKLTALVTQTQFVFAAKS